MVFGRAPGWALFVATGLFASTSVATQHYPIGVSFGQGSISAALIQESGEPLLIANIAATDEYREMMLDSIDYEGLQFQREDQWYLAETHGEPIPISRPGDDLAMEAIFRDNLKNIRNAVTESLGHYINISSVVYPRHLNETALDLITKVALQDEEAMILRDQLRDFYDGALAAYEFQPNNDQAIIIDHNDGYMDDAFGSISQYCSYNMAQLNVRIRGISRERGASNIGSSDEELEEFWNEVGEGYASLMEALSHIGGSTRLKAYILAGEAPSANFARLRQAIASAGSVYAFQIYDSVDPRFAAAVGAARWAKFQVDNQATFFQSEGCLSSHDEL